MYPCIADYALADVSNAAKLEKLREQIQSLREELSSDQAHKKDLQSQLRNTEIQIGKVTALLRGLHRQLRRQKRDLNKLQGQRKTLNSQLQVQRVHLAQQSRSAYDIGQQEYLKILLNQQDPAAVSRTLTYYDYFHRARLKRIKSIDTRLATLRTVEQKIREKSAQLEKNQTEQTKEKEGLQQTQDERGKILAKLNAQIQAKGARLSQMLENQRRLQNLLTKLAEEPSGSTPELNTEQGELKPFASLRGKLPWPSRGRLANRYGSSRKIGRLRWQGLLIKAPEGTDVTAISNGRVAFADWLRGFGLLIIIDHGNGYMSLYGGNQSLYKEVGDWVEAGEVIASVGNSGGNKDSALYFEIRHNGKPTNPLKWCKNKPKKLARAS
jgi:septal ring factor EnvC (AmiA/AmiB activator)